MDDDGREGAVGAAARIRANDRDPGGARGPRRDRERHPVFPGRQERARFRHGRRAVLRERDARRGAQRLDGRTDGPVSFWPGLRRLAESSVRNASTRVFWFTTVVPIVLVAVSRRVYEPATRNRRRRSGRSTSSRRSPRPAIGRDRPSGRPCFRARSRASLRRAQRRMTRGGRLEAVAVLQVEARRRAADVTHRPVDLQVDVTTTGLPARSRAVDAERVGAVLRRTGPRRSCGPGDRARALPGHCPRSDEAVEPLRIFTPPVSGSVDDHFKAVRSARRRRWARSRRAGTRRQGRARRVDADAEGIELRCPDERLRRVRIDRSGRRADEREEVVAVWQARAARRASHAKVCAPAVRRPGERAPRRPPSRPGRSGAAPARRGRGRSPS